MSSTNRSAVRNGNDFYPTPAWCVDRLLEAVDLPGGRWLEPAAGRGAIVAAVNARRADVSWRVVEAFAEPTDRDTYQRLGVAAADITTADFLAAPCGPMDEPVDVVITNPPFNRAIEFVTQAMTYRPCVIAMLLRLNFLGTEGRSVFMRTHAPDVYVLPNRPSFSRQGTDSIEYAWFVWSGARARRTGRVQVLDVTPPAARRGSGRAS